MSPPMKTLRAVTALVPALFAAFGAASGPAAAHDDGVIRAVGLGPTGPFRALDALVSAPAMLLPVGTRVLRAGLASAIAVGIAGWVLFGITQRLASRVVPGLLGRTSAAAHEARLVSAIAAVATLGAMLSPAWQLEGTEPGGAVVGALLVLLAVDAASGGELPPHGALLLGLALSDGPLTFAASALACAPSYRSLRKSHALAFLVGLSPIALGLALGTRAPELAIPAPPWGIDRGGTSSVVAFVTRDVGRILAALASLGIVASLTVAARALRPDGSPRRASIVTATPATSLRSLSPVRVPLPVPDFSSLSPALTTAFGAIAVALHVHAGPSRFDAVVLAAIATAHALAAIALAAVVLFVARARIPFAEASAALVVVLELVLPVAAADESTMRRDTRVRGAAEVWNDVAWGAAPPASVLLVAERSTMRRIAIARATGAMRGDLLVVPTYEVQGRRAEQALLAEPKLAPLYRDLALGVPPEELSLARLGAERAVLATFDPTWDRMLARHFVPLGLTARFETEPRGASDRNRAFDAFAPAKDALMRFVVAKKDADLASATAVLLRARAVTMAATGERDTLARALDDLRGFAPDDRVAMTLVRRQLTSKGTIDVRDLVQ
jgi:hypothetical protein